MPIDTAKLLRAIGSESQAAFARRAGVSPQFLSDILAGRRGQDRLSVDVAAKLAAAAGVTVDELLQKRRTR